jgi:hypothetical protein
MRCEYAFKTVFFLYASGTALLDGISPNTTLKRPRKNPIRAKGSAKIVWENFMRER